MRKAFWQRRGRSKAEKRLDKRVDNHVHSIIVSKLPCVISHHEGHACYGPVKEIDALPMCHDAQLYYSHIGREMFELRWGINVDAEAQYIRRIYKGD